MRLAWLALIAATLSLPACGEPGPSLRIEFSNPSTIPASWSLVLYPNGSGHFHSERGAAPVTTPGIEPVTVDRDVQLDKAFAARAFEVVRRHNILHGEQCDSHMKVAFQGWKKFIYSGPDGSWNCEFNFSKNKEIQGLGDSVVAVASTIVEGARLEMLLQHDPLGLDQALEFIQQGAQDGRLQQVCTIQGVLRRLESDPAVMERVRKRARTLLAGMEK